MPELLGAGGLLGEYLERAAAAGYGVSRLRLMLGRSDSAMVYGLVPSVLAVKAAISDCCALGRENNLDVLPIFGGGALPFRGHVTLENLAQLAVDYAGIRTVTVQSGLRYDVGSAATRQVAIQAGERLGPAGAVPLAYSAAERDEITTLIGMFTLPYLKSFTELLPAVISVSDVIPRQRDRLARKSAVGYARAAAEPAKLAVQIADEAVAGQLAAAPPLVTASLPRAISFTGALYAIGLPPEFIGTGRGLAAVSSRFGEDGVRRLLEIYPGLPADLAQAAHYANPGTAALHLPAAVMARLDEDFKEVSSRLGITAGPASVEDQRYHVLLETVQPLLRQLAAGEGEWAGEIADRDLVTEWICRLGRLRGSLG